MTLTYDDEHVPKNMSLNVEDFQLFMKRLRRGSSSPLRYFHCGEYGEENLRPHYHVCLFGEDFSDDRVLDKETRRGDPLYTSLRLSEVWSLGHAWIGDLSFESAAYVARYCLKKVTGSDELRKKKGLCTVKEHYGDRVPEYVTMSRRPGIGSDWYRLYSSEVYPSDSVVIKRGDRYVEMLPPPYYDKLLEKVDPALYSRVKRERVRASKEFGESLDSSSRRLLDREKVKRLTIDGTLKRSL